MSCVIALELVRSFFEQKKFRKRNFMIDIDHRKEDKPMSKTLNDRLQQ
jgi:hypothetical protein